MSLRGCEELLPQEDWVKKLARSEATGTPLRIKLGLDPTNSLQPFGDPPALSDAGAA